MEKFHCQTPFGVYSYIFLYYCKQIFKIIYVILGICEMRASWKSFETWVFFFAWIWWWYYMLCTHIILLSIAHNAIREFDIRDMNLMNVKLNKFKHWHKHAFHVANKSNTYFNWYSHRFIKIYITHIIWNIYRTYAVRTHISLT